MATQRDTDLCRALRAAGLRKKLAHAVTDATRKTRRGKQSKLLVRTIENLNTAAAESERGWQETQRGGEAGSPDSNARGAGAKHSRRQGRPNPHGRRSLTHPAANASVDSCASGLVVLVATDLRGR